MFIISLIIVNVIFAILIRIYCKLTYGICKFSKHLVGKVVIVTGANNGIGYESAKNLAERGARVILACRNVGRGTAARDKIIAATGNRDVHFIQLDLASFASVRTFADNVISNENRLDILINNAGIHKTDNVKTEDGLFVGMQTNHFGPFLLTSLLLPLLKSSAPSRIINVSSMAYRSGVLDFDNINMEKETKETFSTFRAYQTSKLCNVLITSELDRILKGSGVTVNCLHPGVVDTELIAEVQIPALKYLLPLFKYFMKNPWEGAQTTIYLAVSSEVENISGKFFSDCRIQTLTQKAQDKELARTLWEVSERLVN